MDMEKNLEQPQYASKDAPKEAKEWLETTKKELDDLAVKLSKEKNDQQKEKDLPVFENKLFYYLNGRREEMENEIEQKRKELPSAQFDLGSGKMNLEQKIRGFLLEIPLKLKELQELRETKKGLKSKEKITKEIEWVEETRDKLKKDLETEETLQYEIRELSADLRMHITEESERYNYMNKAGILSEEVKHFEQDLKIPSSKLLANVFVKDLEKSLPEGEIIEKDEIKKEKQNIENSLNYVFTSAEIKKSDCEEYEQDMLKAVYSKRLSVDFSTVAEFDGQIEYLMRSGISMKDLKSVSQKDIAEAREILDEQEQKGEKAGFKEALRKHGPKIVCVMVLTGVLFGHAPAFADTVQDGDNERMPAEEGDDPSVQRFKVDDNRGEIVDENKENKIAIPTDTVTETDAEIEKIYEITDRTGKKIELEQGDKIILDGGDDYTFEKLDDKGKIILDKGKYTYDSEKFVITQEGEEDIKLNKINTNGEDINPIGVLDTNGEINDYVSVELKRYNLSKDFENYNQDEMLKLLIACKAGGNEKQWGEIKKFLETEVDKKEASNKSEESFKFALEADRSLDTANDKADITKIINLSRGLELNNDEIVELFSTKKQGDVKKLLKTAGEAEGGGTATPQTGEEPAKKDIATTPVPAVEAEGPIGYQDGKHIWGSVKNFLKVKYGDDFIKLGDKNITLKEALWTYNIDDMKDEIVRIIERGTDEEKVKFGLDGIDNPDKVTTAELEKIDYDKIAEEVFLQETDNETGEQKTGLTEKLSDEDAESIVKNNEKLKKFFKAHPNISRSNAIYEDILNPAPEAEYLKTANMTDRGIETVETEVFADYNSEERIEHLDELHARNTELTNEISVADKNEEMELVKKLRTEQDKLASRIAEQTIEHRKLFIDELTKDNKLGIRQAERVFDLTDGGRDGKFLNFLTEEMDEAQLLTIIRNTSNENQATIMFYLIHQEKISFTEVKKHLKIASIFAEINFYNIEGNCDYIIEAMDVKMEEKNILLLGKILAKDNPEKSMRNLFGVNIGEFQFDPDNDLKATLELEKGGKKLFIDYENQSIGIEPAEASKRKLRFNFSDIKKGYSQGSVFERDLDENNLRTIKDILGVKSEDVEEIEETGEDKAGLSVKAKTGKANDDITEEETKSAIVKKQAGQVELAKLEPTEKAIRPQISAEELEKIKKYKDKIIKEKVYLKLQLEALNKETDRIKASGNKIENNRKKSDAKINELRRGLDETTERLKKVLNQQGIDMEQINKDNDLEELAKGVATDQGVVEQKWAEANLDSKSDQQAELQEFQDKYDKAIEKLPKDIQAQIESNIESFDDEQKLKFYKENVFSNKIKLGYLFDEIYIPKIEDIFAENNLTNVSSGIAFELNYFNIDISVPYRNLAGELVDAGDFEIKIIDNNNIYLSLEKMEERINEELVKMKKEYGDWREAQEKNWKDWRKKAKSEQEVNTDQEPILTSNKMDELIKKGDSSELKDNLLFNIEKKGNSTQEYIKIGVNKLLEAKKIEFSAEVLKRGLMAGVIKDSDFVKKAIDTIAENKMGYRCYRTLQHSINAQIITNSDSGYVKSILEKTIENKDYSNSEKIFSLCIEQNFITDLKYVDTINKQISSGSIRELGNITNSDKEKLLSGLNGLKGEDLADFKIAVFLISGEFSEGLNDYFMEKIKSSNWNFQEFKKSINADGKKTGNDSLTNEFKRQVEGVIKYYRDRQFSATPVKQKVGEKKSN